MSGRKIKMSQREVSYVVLLIFNTVGLISVYGDLPKKVGEKLSKSLCTSVPLKTGLSHALQPRFWYLYLGITLSAFILVKLARDYEVILKTKKQRHAQLIPLVLVGLLTLVVLILSKKCNP